MTKHHGSHPRMGAVDVMHMPIKVENDEAIKTYEFEKYIGSKGIPINIMNCCPIRSGRAWLISKRSI